MGGAGGLNVVRLATPPMVTTVPRKRRDTEADQVTHARRAKSRRYSGAKLLTRCKAHDDMSWGAGGGREPGGGIIDSAAIGDAGPDGRRAYLEALRDDAALLARAVRQPEVQRVEQPRPEGDGVGLGVCGERSLRGRDDGLQELVRRHLAAKGARVPHLAHQLAEPLHEVAAAVRVVRRDEEEVSARRGFVGWSRDRPAALQ